jgi:hypothetical protein
LCFTDYIIEQVPSLLTRFWSLFFCHMASYI